MHYSADERVMIDDVTAGYRRAGHKAWTIYHTYSSDPAAIGTADGFREAVPFQFSIDEDSFFIWTGLVSYMRDVDHGSSQSANTGELLTILLDGPKYHLTGEGPMPFQILTGSGEYPHVFGFPIILTPGEKIRMGWMFTEEVAVSAQITLTGAKLYTTPFSRDVIIPGQ